MSTITVRNLLFADDGDTLGLDSPDGWQKFAIGINANINLRALAEGDAFADMPATLPVELTSRSPNLAGGTATLKLLRSSMAKTVDVSGFTIYALNKSWTDLSFKNVDTVKEVATVVRQGKDATADVEFRNNVNFVGRGFARQPSAKLNPDGKTATMDPDSGDPSKGREIPPAELLLLSGGLEILEAKIPPAQERKVMVGPARALIQSPADLWFYSGHGLPSGKLAIELLGDPHNFIVWKGPSDFLDSWASTANLPNTKDMVMLIINGCNVLNLDPAFKAPGKEWAKLLKPTGNLTHILGYAAKAPLDVGGGADIAAGIGKAIRSGENPVKAWLQINSLHRRWGAVAIDAAGYYAFDANHKPAGPTPIP